MNWRSSTDWKDKLFSSLVYLIPLFYSLQFGSYLLEQFPFLQIILIPLLPLIVIYSIPFASLIIFIILYAAVVRNYKISRFIRFNTMQAILIDILLFLVSIVSDFIFQGIRLPLLTETIYNTFFLGTLVACIYAIFNCVQGKYPEIPAVSEAAHSQVPY